MAPLLGHAAPHELSIESNDVVHLKDEQEKTVDCLLDRRDVLAVMPTGFGIINCNDRKESS